MAPVTCPVCEHAFDASGGSSLAECPHCHVRFLAPDAQEAYVLARRSKRTPETSSAVPIPPELRSKYRFGRLLGSGAMGTVYLAQSIASGELFAAKFLARPDRPDDLARFLRERQVLYRIDHPNVVRVVEAGDAGGHPYLVLEYVDGGTLRDRIKSAGKLEPIEAVDWIVQILAGLQACHEAGVVHRDLKPANVLLARHGVAKLADLGVARDVESVGPNITKVGVIVGTPRYMAPEVLQAAPATASSDLYSAGVVLYEMLAGVVPYPWDNPYQIARRMQLAPPPPVDTLALGVSPALSACVARALDHRIEGRPASAGAWQEELHRTQR
jgi:serine/threonine-protein kinase